MAALAYDARPVGGRHHRDAGVDDPADHRDMAEAELGRFGEHDHRADAGCVAALVAILGLAPPCPGVTVDLDTRGRARERHALADVIEQRTGERHNAPARAAAIDRKSTRLNSSH